MREEFYEPPASVRDWWVNWMTQGLQPIDLVKDKHGVWVYPEEVLCVSSGSSSESS